MRAEADWLLGVGGSADVNPAATTIGPNPGAGTTPASSMIQNANKGGPAGPVVVYSSLLSGMEVRAISGQKNALYT